MELTTLLIPLLLSDIINPVLFAITVFTLGSQHPIINTIRMLFGFFSTYFLAGIIIGVGFEEILEYLKNPTTIDYIIEFITGILVIGFSIYLMRQKDYQHEPQFKKPVELKSWNSFLLGVQANVVGLPFALPYLAAIDQVLKANLHPATGTLVLLLYNIGYILPFSLMIVIKMVYHDESKRIFENINYYLLKISDKVLPIFLLLLGLFLILDSGIYFFRLFNNS